MNENETGGSDEKLIGREIRVDNRFPHWISNFWYHYKWYVIVIAFFAITFLICFMQCASNEKEDAVIVFAGPAVFSSEQTSALLTAFGDVMPKDLTGDGKKIAGLDTFMHYTEEDLAAEEKKALEEYPDAEKVTSYIGQLRINSNTDASRYATAVNGGVGAILIISEDLYQTLRAGNRLSPLDDILEKTPDKQLNGYAVRISDTAFYRDYEVAKVIPSNTVICFLIRPLTGNIHNEAQYQFEQELFRAIVGN